MDTSDGIKISGWFVSAKKARGVVLYFHGNAGNISDKLATVDHLRPVLVVHSREDEVVPFKYGRKPYESLSSKKYFLEISGEHNDGFIVSDDYLKGLDQFVSEIFGKKQ